MASDYAPNQIIPGTVYQVVCTLGSAGTGTVYEVEDTTVGKRYVLKTLHAELRHREELALRITKEARTLATLSHVNIVEVVTAGVTADALCLPYFVMQMLNGHTLRTILEAKGALPLQTALSITIDLLDALDHAHAHGVIHRDVKPENVFVHRTVSGATVTKLLDFGVMRLLTSGLANTGHRFVGSLRYAQPEQLEGGAVTARTDLYGAALVLYEMIVGRGPFDDAPNDREIAAAHLRKPAPLLSSRVFVPRALDEIVASALAKDPGLRPHDAFTFAARLREISLELAEGAFASVAAGDAAHLRGQSEPLHTDGSETGSLRGTSHASEPRGPRARSMFPLYAGALAICGVTAIAVGGPMLRGRSESRAAASSSASTKAPTTPTSGPLPATVTTLSPAAPTSSAVTPMAPLASTPPAPSHARPPMHVVPAPARSTTRPSSPRTRHADGGAASEAPATPRHGSAAKG